MAVDFIELLVTFRFLEIEEGDFDACGLLLSLLHFLSKNTFTVKRIFVVLEHVDNSDEILRNGYSFRNNG